MFTLVPAYGKDYNSVGAVIEAWKAGKDFRIKQKTSVINIRDAEEFGVPDDRVCIRYNKERDVVTIRVEHKED